MKALVLVENDRISNTLRFYLKPLGFEVVRYRSPIKALDNLDEVEPDAIIMSARDFPRHWKILAQAVRANRTKEQCIIILLKGENFDFEEAAKAARLAVNGVIGDDLDDFREQATFQRLLRRYVTVEDSRHADRVSPSAWDRLDFMFAHPASLQPVTGRLETLSLSGLSFIPDSPALVADLEDGERLEDCSLRVGDKLITLSCQVARADRVMGLSIVSLSKADRSTLVEYLAARPERELQALSHRG
jgi:hypothetical protein